MDSSLRQLCQSRKQYPLLSEVAEICYSAPVTTAWPERGASAVKRIKKRYMLQHCHLHLQTWLNDKSRYKLKRVPQPRQPSTEKTEPPHAAFFSAATQTGVIALYEDAEVE